VKHVYWVIPGLLAGRPGPDEFPWDLDELHRAGLRAILSLHAGGVDVADIRRYGFVHKLLPLPDSVPPSPEDLLSYQRLLPQAFSFIRYQLVDRIPTLVHCHAGRDRTGVVLASYLSTYMGMEPAEAVERLRAIKSTALSAEGYDALVHYLCWP
jgi:protein-tyrosine phosphatase